MLPPIIWLWAVLAAIFLILEVSLTGILQIWFAIGAFVAGIVAYFLPENYVAQFLTFIFVSGVLTAIFTPMFSDQKSKEASKTPVYSILGKTALVTKEIDTDKGLGQIAINGDVWSAKAKEGEIIPENSKVKVLEVDGVKAVVELIKE